ncbi:hypothetical protein KFU94_48605 [Chloroflexi bacterium TSY]|nr:hypothetical protein [Chloroflexi bacterium TSY]
MHEYQALDRLYNAGAAAPRPVAVSENAILMSYHGDERMAASTLNEVSLDGDEARKLFHKAMHNVELMLRLGYVHGDLSAYDILYWQNDITIIDFPQITSVEGNRQAYAILQRDIERVCDYFDRQGVDCDAETIADSFWQRYRALNANERAADDALAAQTLFGIEDND